MVGQLFFILCFDIHMHDSETHLINEYVLRVGFLDNETVNSAKESV